MVTDEAKWIVWYSDGSSFSNLDGAPDKAPRWGVLCISEQSREHGRMIWHGTDYYAWCDEAWISLDATGLVDYLGNIPGAEKIVLMGRHVNPKIFYPILTAAEHDPRLPARSSRDAMEDWRKQL